MDFGGMSQKKGAAPGGRGSKAAHLPEDHVVHLVFILAKLGFAANFDGYGVHNVVSGCEDGVPFTRSDLAHAIIPSAPTILAEEQENTSNPLPGLLTDAQGRGEGGLSVRWHKA